MSIFNLVKELVDVSATARHYGNEDKLKVHYSTNIASNVRDFKGISMTFSYHS